MPPPSASSSTSPTSSRSKSSTAQPEPPPSPLTPTSTSSSPPSSASPVSKPPTPPSCAGKTVGLANKECLVAAGDLILAAAREHSVHPPPHRLRTQRHPPMPSAAAHPNEVKQIWLTASGGPFRNTPARRLRITSLPPRPSNTPPGSWAGASPSTPPPCSTRAFEIIEACRLFNLPTRPRPRHHPPPIHHPLSRRVHRRQHPRPDLRHRHAPPHPLRARPTLNASPSRATTPLTFDLATLSQPRLCQQPDFARFPCLRLAYEAAAASQNALHRSQRGG